jgi:hypothetical protein
MPSEASDEPRRFLIAVGVQSYVSDDRWRQLDKAACELNTIVNLLESKKFGVKRILLEQSKLLADPNEMSSRDRFLSALSAWTKSDDRRPTDHLIIYWTGHGEVDSDQLYFVLPTTRELLIDGLQVQKLSDILLHPDSRLGPILLLFDVCYAGQGALDLAARLPALTRQRSRDAPPGISMICATGPRYEADQMVFSKAFEQAVESAVDPDKTFAPDIPITDILKRIRWFLKDTGQKIYAVDVEIGDKEFLRNPYYIPHLPSGIDVGTARLFAALGTPGRGVTRSDDAGWFFKGRKRVFNDLSLWLNTERGPGLGCVTGSIGSGKSAVLGRLYTLSREDYRKNVPREVLSQTPLPPLRSIDAAIVLTKMTLPEVISEVSTRLHVSASNQEQLIAKLRDRDTCPTLLFDGLDEAVGPVRTQQFLELLAGTTSRIIVGVRQWPDSLTIAPQLNIDLDQDPWSDRTAVKEYVYDRLTKETAGATTRPAWLQDLASVSSKVAERANCNFLMASLIVTAIVTGTAGDPGSPKWEFPEQVGMALDRLLEKLGDDLPEVRDLLVPLAYAEGSGLPKGRLWPRIAEKLSDRENATLDVKKLFARAPWFIVAQSRFGRTGFRVFHIALANLLRKGREDSAVHLSFVRQLESALAGSHGHEFEDKQYARHYLAGHLRKAQQWRELAELVTSSDWIKAQSSQPLFESELYDSDVEEARAAGRDANLHAFATQRDAPALGAEIWWVLWRSGLITVAQKIPSQAWAFLCQYGGLHAQAAIKSIAAIGDEQVRAARFAALGRVLRGADLDALLDYAEGIKLSPDLNNPPSGISRHHSDRPIAQYHDILREALFGQDARRLTQRALKAAHGMQGYARWAIIEAALPHLDNQELDEAGELVRSIGRGLLDLPWRSRATAAYVAERARRPEKGAATNDTPLVREGLLYWFALAGLLAVRKEGHAVDLEEVTVPGAMASAMTTVDDFLDRLEVMTVMVRALPDIATLPNRRALKSYLKKLRESSSANKQILLAASAGESLPNPHGARLLRWAVAIMKASRRDLNVNWYHTPPRLALALARGGLAPQAIDVALMTEGHPYFRPKALADVGRALAARSENDFAAAVQTIDARFGGENTVESLQLRCSGADKLTPDERVRILHTLNGYGLALGDAIRETLCWVQASLASYSERNEILNLRDHLVRNVEALSPYAKAESLTRFACGCAKAGHGELALEMIAAIGNDLSRRETWRDVLASASDASLSSLLNELVRDEHALYAVLELDSARAALIKVISRLPRELLELMERAVTAHAETWSEYRTRELSASLVVRGFEIGEQELAKRQIPIARGGFDVLDAVRRLTIDGRRKLIQLLQETHEFSSPECSALARLLVADRGQKAGASEAFVEAIGARGSHWGSSRSWIVRWLAPDARQRFIDDAFEIVLTEGSPRPRDVDWMLRWLGQGQLDRLLAAAETHDDDYQQDALVVSVLARYAEACGYHKALAIRETIRRGDFQALSWAALWQYLPAAERSSVFSLLTPAEAWEDGRHAKALGNIAQLLDAAQFTTAARWIVQMNPGHLAHLLGPFVRVACQKGREDAYNLWEAILEEVSHRPAAEAMSYIQEAIPISEHVGGKEGLTSIQTFLSRAAELWP